MPPNRIQPTVDRDGEPNIVSHSFVSRHNIKVHFPFQPYELQKDYIDSVHQALTRGKNALLESPTGTGKTLSLLCSTLSWLQSQPIPAPIVYYGSRTHLQLAQAAKEMKKTAYRKVPAVVLGGRNQMCLNDDVKHCGGDHLINRACRNAIAKNACSYYSNYEQKMDKIDTATVNDIEDLIKFGQRNECCPYYVSKKLAETKASVIFTPYNYLLNSSLRKALQLKLEKSVIIFDEAHNIEDALKDSVSGTFNKTCLNDIIKCCDSLPSKISNALQNDKGISRYGYEPKEPRIVNEFKQNNKPAEKEPKANPIEELAEKLTNDKLRRVRTFCELLILSMEDRIRGSIMVADFYTILDNCGFSFETSSQLIMTLDSMISFLQIAGVQDISEVNRYVSAITNLCDSISIFCSDSLVNLHNFKIHQQKVDSVYVIHLEHIIDEKTHVLKDWQLCFWCLHPGFGLKQMIDSSCVQGVRSLIITSGTLAPMKSLETELDIKFDPIREFPHIINSSQMRISIIESSPQNKLLTSTKEFTDKPEYPIILGNSLIALFKVLPYGTIVFFQSYGLMDKVIKVWKEKSMMFKNMEKVTKIFVESKKASDFTSDLISFKKHIDLPIRNSAVFFGVCRGKLSEGVNLEKNYCRTVIITGLPFPRLNDPKVVYTRQFQQKFKRDNNGSRWYELQMQRALNQTIGRVIRSKSDFGMLLLCDPRFSRCQSSLSRWAQKIFPTSTSSFPSIENEIKEFFSIHGIDITDSISENIGAFEVGMPKALQLNKSSHHHQVSIAGTSSQSLPTKSIQQREKDLLAAYTVSRDVLEQIQTSRLEEQRRQEQSEVPTKKQRKTDEIFEALFNVEVNSSLQTYEESSIVPSTNGSSTPKRSSNIFKKKSNTQQSIQSSDPTVAKSSAQVRFVLRTKLLKNFNIASYYI